MTCSPRSCAHVLGLAQARARVAILATAFLLGACGGSDRVADDGGRTVDADLRVLPCGAEGSSGPTGRCACGTECAPGLLCGPESTSHFPGGFCIQTCMPGDPTGCPDGFDCVGTTAASFCAPRCETALDCAAGRICLNGVGEHGVCGPYCDEDKECTSAHCDLLSGQCTDGTPRPGAGLDERCVRHEDCQSGHCDAGRCITFCSVADPHCPDGTACTTYFGQDIGLCHAVCEPGGAPCPVEGMACVESTSSPGVHLCTSADSCFGPAGDNTDGRPCGCDADCDSGSMCVTEATFPVPHGACFRNCAAGPSVCPAGSRCALVAGSGGTMACLTSCTTTAECGLGRVCSPAHTCEPICQRDDDCVSLHCDPWSTFCSPSNPSLLRNGVSCMTSAQCRSGLCYTAATGGQKICESFCSASAQVCPDGGICVPFSSSYDYGACLPACTMDTDCPMGMHCGDAGVPSMSLMACIA